jgi:hypothetical protein
MYFSKKRVQFMKRLSFKRALFPLCACVLAAVAFFLGFLWAKHKERVAARYPSVSSQPIQAGKPIEAPEKEIVLQKPVPRIR